MIKAIYLLLFPFIFIFWIVFAIMLPIFIVYIISDMIETIYPDLWSPFIPLVLIVYFILLVIFFYNTSLRRQFISIIELEEDKNIYRIWDEFYWKFKITPLIDFFWAEIEIKLNCNLASDYNRKKNITPVFSVLWEIIPDIQFSNLKNWFDLIKWKTYEFKYKVNIPNEKTLIENGLTQNICKFEIWLYTDLKDWIAWINYRNFILNVQ